MFMKTNLFFFSRNRNINKKENFKEIQTEIQEYFSLFSNVIKFDLEKYDREFVYKLNTNVTSFDGNYYIYKTFDTHTRKLKVPGQAVVNGLIIEKKYQRN